MGWRLMRPPFLKGKEAHVKERRGRGRPLPPAIRLSSPSFPFLSGKRKAYRSIRRNGRNMSSLGLPCSHLNKRNESKTKSKRSKLWLSFLERKRNQTISRSCLPFPKGKGKERKRPPGRSLQRYFLSQPLFPFSFSLRSKKE